MPAPARASQAWISTNKLHYSPKFVRSEYPRWTPGISSRARAEGRAKSLERELLTRGTLAVPMRRPENPEVIEGQELRERLYRTAWCTGTGLARRSRIKQLPQNTELEPRPFPACSAECCR